MLAGKTLVVSLPAEWTKKWAVKKGQELEVKDKGKMLEIEPIGCSKRRKATITGERNERVLRWTLSALHKKGYDAIEIMNYNNHTPDIVKEVIRDLFIGFTITEQTEKRIVIEAISQDEEKNFKQVLRRAFLVTLELAEKLHSRLLERKETKDLLHLEKLNNQLTNHCQRLLNKFEINKENKTFYYVILWNLEKVADDYKYLINTMNQTPKITDNLGVVNKLLRDYYTAFYNYDNKRINEMANTCKDLKKKLLNDLKKEPINCHLYNIVQKIGDFNASTIALNSTN